MMHMQLGRHANVGQVGSHLASTAITGSCSMAGPLLPNQHSGNGDAPPSDTIALTPAALAEAAAASGARLTKVAASGARQPAAQDEEMLMMRDWTSMKHNDPQWINTRV